MPSKVYVELAKINEADASGGLGGSTNLVPSFAFTATTLPPVGRCAGRHPALNNGVKVRCGDGVALVRGAADFCAVRSH